MSSGLQRLFAEVAPNAILNAEGRTDEPKCFPGTRKEIIRRLEKFMDDESAGKKRMMWLNGPAGAGKSAIFQTVAGRCSEHGRHAANFFFGGDSSRNRAKPLVATLAYQLRCFYPALNELLANCLESDPLICGAPIETQFKQLISTPFQTIQQSTPTKQHIWIIIDGLDECYDTRDQGSILDALQSLVNADRSPFRVLVSSRAEPHLVTSFNRSGVFVESIALNDEYKPERDIRLFISSRLSEIKRVHHLARTLRHEWPKIADVEAIASRSSGQFTYATTVMRYIEFSSPSPALSLATILEMPPPSKQTPFAHLDAVYSHIFSKVHDLRAVKLILFARKCPYFKSGPPIFLPMVRLAGYKDIEVQSLFADLAAIVKVVPGSNSRFLEFYDASLSDFLSDKSRSTIYCVTENAIAAEFSSMCLANIHDAYSIQLTMNSLHWVEEPTSELSKSLLDASMKHLSGDRREHFLEELIGNIERLYWGQDNDLFKTLLQSWTRFVRVNNIDTLYQGRIHPRNPSSSWYYKQYWMTERHAGHPPLSPPDSAQSFAFFSLIHRLLDSLWQKVTHRQPPGTSHAIIRNGEAHRSRECDGGPYDSNMIRVKLYYQDDIRGMTLTPDTQFSELIDKVTTKFGKNFNDLILTFKDEDGAKITLRDDSDYEHAIETALESSKGKADGKLEIWCEDST